MTITMHTRPDLQLLVERAQRGDREAFDHLIDTCGSDLKKHVRTRVGEHLRSKVEVEDVLQETYTRAWKSMPRFQWTGSGALLGWLKGIAEHVILKFVSRHRRDEVIFVEQEPIALDAEPSPSKGLRREERLSRLKEAIDNLSPDYREAVLSVRIKGLKVKEAAERMNRSPNAVMHLLLRALKKLKDDLGDTESLHLPPGRLEDSGGPRDG